MSDRVPADTLSDAELRHELNHLKFKQSDIQASGTPAQRANHAERTSALEAEFLRRFPPGSRPDNDGDDASR